MAFKKPYDEEELKKKNVKVKNSYYTFSKDYPIGNLTKRKNSRKKENRLLIRRISIMLLCFVIVAAAAFFATEVCLKFSYKAPNESESVSNTEQTLPQEENSASLSVKAFFLPEDKIADTAYIKRLISQIKRYDANGVVISFKTEDGHLAFSSDNEYAISSNAALYDNETLRNALSLFSNKNISIIAQIYCFEDPLLSGAKPQLAVKYMDTDVSWIDDTEENGGKSWLNPCSAKARSYLLDVISQAQDFGVSGFILKSVSFPTKGAVDTAGYPGEKDKSQRNEVLQSFIKKAKAEILPGSFLLVSQSTDETINSETPYLYGTLTTSTADGFCADISSRPEEYVIDRKTEYSSILSLFSKLENAVGSKEKLVAGIDSSECSHGFLRTLSKSGYENFIIY